jgi:predicted TIM-barrel fold metal-dependent hydrolase
LAPTASFSLSTTPIQFQQQAVEWIDSVPISEPERELICHGNAERIFKME